MPVSVDCLQCLEVFTGHSIIAVVTIMLGYILGNCYNTLCMSSYLALLVVCAPLLPGSSLCAICTCSWLCMYTIRLVVHMREAAGVDALFMACRVVWPSCRQFDPQSDPAWLWFLLAILHAGSPSTVAKVPPCTLIHGSLQPEQVIPSYLSSSLHMAYTATIERECLCHGACHGCMLAACQMQCLPL